MYICIYKYIYTYIFIHTHTHRFPPALGPLTPPIPLL